jgi:hypothetical protein
MDRPVVILSPHLDDAAYACFSLLEGAVVVNVFDGVPEAGTLSWWDERCGASDSADQARRRIAEDRAALTPYVAEIRSLGVLEAAYRPDGGADADEIRPVVESRLRDHGDLLSAATVYAPVGGGSPQHSDHLDLREVTRSLRGALDFALTLYADDGYCLTDGKWPGFLVAGGPEPPPWWSQVLADVPEIGSLEAAERVRLEADRAAAKRRLMEAYETQWATLNEISDPPDELKNPEAYSWEFFWTLTR